LRATEMAWVNQEAQRGHGFDKLGHFLADADIQNGDGRPGVRLDAAQLASDAIATSDAGRDERIVIVGRLRNPKTLTASQATTSFMPPPSGDGGPRTAGQPQTWLSLRPSQYTKFERWGSNQFSTGKEPTFPPLESMNPDEQVEALQRGGLEPCAGGP